MPYEVTSEINYDVTYNNCIPLALTCKRKGLLSNSPILKITFICSCIAAYEDEVPPPGKKHKQGISLTNTGTCASCYHALCCMYSQPGLFRSVLALQC